jgi:hypothetical protein
MRSTLAVTLAFALAACGRAPQGAELGDPSPDGQPDGLPSKPARKPTDSAPGPSCTPGAIACNGDRIETCDASGQPVVDMVCAAPATCVACDSIAVACRPPPTCSIEVKDGPVVGATSDACAQPTCTGRVVRHPTESRSSGTFTVGAGELGRWSINIADIEVFRLDATQRLNNAGSHALYVHVYYADGPTSFRNEWAQNDFPAPEGGVIRATVASYEPGADASIEILGMLRGDSGEWERFHATIAMKLRGPE